MAYKGYQVTHIMNITDLDDRTIEGAEKAGMPLKDFTDMYYKAFLEDIDQLNILRATAYPLSSEHVTDMITMAQHLLEKVTPTKNFDPSTSTSPVSRAMGDYQKSIWIRSNWGKP